MRFRFSTSSTFRSTLWEVARAAFGTNAQQQKAWVETQQAALKQSQWPAVVKAAQRLPPAAGDLADAVERLVSYLTNNQSRIDYQRLHHSKPDDWFGHCRKLESPHCHHAPQAVRYVLVEARR